MNLFQEIATKQTTLIDKVSIADKEKLETVFNKINTANKEERNFKAYLKSLPPLPETKYLSLKKHRDVMEVNVFNQLLSLMTKEVSDLISYFNNTYGLSVVIKDKPFDEACKGIESFLKQYFRAGNITDLKKGGEDKLINDFHNAVSSYWSIRATLSNKTVRLKDFYSIDEFTYKLDSSWRVSYSYRNNVRLLKSAIFFFETGELNSHPYLAKDLIPDEKISDPVIDLSILEKLKSLQFYKNGSIKITFPNKTEAKSFFELYRFDQLRTRN